MAWRDELRPASFRGVSFYVEGGTLTFGRRLAIHEYPQREKPYVEDLGKKARVYRLEAFVLGPDYMKDRDALIDALETPRRATGSSVLRVAGCYGFERHRCQRNVAAGWHGSHLGNLCRGRAN